MDLDSDTLSALALHPNIVGTKLSCGQIGKLARLATRHEQSNFSPFIGRSDVFLPALLAGGAGGIMALVNLAPRVHCRLFAAWIRGDFVEAKRLQDILVHADWAIGKIGGIPGLKAFVSEEFGYGTGAVRGPLSLANESILTADYTSALRDLAALEKSLPDQAKK